MEVRLFDVEAMIVRRNVQHVISALRFTNISELSLSGCVCVHYLNLASAAAAGDDVVFMLTD